MLFPIEFLSKNMYMLYEDDCENSPDHLELTERLRKTLYYGKMPDTDRPSLPITEIAVEFFQEAAPRELGRVDTFVASNVARRACMSPCSLMLGMIYIERLKQRNPEYLQTVSSSDLFLISMMVASKYLYDEGVDEEVFNDEWAESAKMDVDDLNTLERDFLTAMEWGLFVKGDEFWKVLNALEQRIAQDKGAEHGFYQYSDLLVLTNNARLYHVFRAAMLEICKVMMVCSVAYVAGVLTMVGSTMTVVCLRHQVAPQVSMPHQPLPDMQDPVAPPVDILPTNLMEHDLNENCSQHGLDSTGHSRLDGTGHSRLDGTGHSRLDSTGHSSLDSTGHGRLDSSGHSHLDSTGSNTNYAHPFVSRDLEHDDHGLRIPGLLTLVLLKDTVLQFVRASKQRYGHSENRHEKHTQAQESEMVCTCGCCHGNVLDRCFNITKNSQDNGCYRNSQYGRSGAGGNSGTKEWESCDVDEDCRCCCHGNHNMMPWQQLLTWKVLPPVHDIEMGFGTTAQAFS